MTRSRKWLAVAAGIVGVGALVTLWLSSQLLTCQYKESSPTFDPAGKFYAQMQFTVCRDDAQSRARLVLGARGRQDKAILLDLSPSADSVDLSWHGGPELHVRVSESAIIKKYGPTTICLES